MTTVRTTTKATKEHRAKQAFETNATKDRRYLRAEQHNSSGGTNSYKKRICVVVLSIIAIILICVWRGRLHDFAREFQKNVNSYEDLPPSPASFPSRRVRSVGL